MIYFTLKCGRTRNACKHLVKIIIDCLIIWTHTDMKKNPVGTSSSIYSNFRPLTLTLSVTNQLVPKETNSVVTTIENLIIRQRRRCIFNKYQTAAVSFRPMFPSRRKNSLIAVRWNYNGSYFWGHTVCILLFRSHRWEKEEVKRIVTIKNSLFE